MSIESAAVRKRKRIVEHIISGFKTAKEAIVFGNTFEAVIQGKLEDFVKFKQWIGSPDTSLAITEAYAGETVLKTCFLDVPNNEAANFICESLKVVAGKHEEVHKTKLVVNNEVIRDKPQPQILKR